MPTVHLPRRVNSQDVAPTSHRHHSHREVATARVGTAMAGYATGVGVVAMGGVGAGMGAVDWAEEEME